MDKLMRALREHKKLPGGNTNVANMYRDDPWFWAGIALLTGFAPGLTMFGFGLGALGFGLGIGATIIAAQRLVVALSGHFALTSMTISTVTFLSTAIATGPATTAGNILQMVFVFGMVPVVDAVLLHKALRGRPQPTAGPAPA